MIKKNKNSLDSIFKTKLSADSISGSNKIDISVYKSSMGMSVKKAKISSKLLKRTESTVNSIKTGSATLRSRNKTIKSLIDSIEEATDENI
jgi:hypothetical protein